MGEVLLVAATPEEESALSAVGVRVRSLPSTAVDGDTVAALAGTGVDAIVVGPATRSPLDLVQALHRALPHCGVVVLTTPDTDAQVRRAAMYAPDMPVSLTVALGGRDDLVAVVRDAVEYGRLDREHRATIAAVSSHAAVSAPHALPPASLGALLDHAPFGVLVGDLEGRLVTWNRWAADSLDLRHDAGGTSLPGLFPLPQPLEESFTLARQGRLLEGSRPFVIRISGDTDVEVSTAPTLLDDGQAAVLVLLQDVSARRHAERTRDLLAEHVDLLGRVSEAVAGTLDVDHALGRLAEVVVPSFADWVSIQTYERGESRRVVVHHRDPALGGELARAREGIMRGLAPTSPGMRVAAGSGAVLLQHVSGEQLHELVDDDAVRESIRRMGVASVVAAPIPGRDDVLGSLSLVRGPGSPPYNQQDVAVAVEVGRRAGVALDTAALYARQRDLAAGLQRSLLTEPPQPDRADIVVRYVAAAEEAQVGGDWYDAFVQADGDTVLVIGDVMGHDTRAAAAMGQLRALLRGIGYTTGAGPAEMLTRLDAAIEGLRVQTTATGLVVRLEARAPAEDGPARLCWSNAGHPPPVVVRPGRPAVALEHDEPDLLLGVLADAGRQEAGASLEPGGTLLLYTDGLIERRGMSIDEGVATLKATLDRLADVPLAELCDRLLAELLPARNEDDVALVAVRLHETPDSGAVQEQAP